LGRRGPSGGRPCRGGQPDALGWAWSRADRAGSVQCGHSASHRGTRSRSGCNVTRCIVYGSASWLPPTRRRKLWTDDGARASTAQRCQHGLNPCPTTATGRHSTPEDAGAEASLTQVSSPPKGKRQRLLSSQEAMARERRRTPGIDPSPKLIWRASSRQWETRQWQ
jgi:hypothetical protein